MKDRTAARLVALLLLLLNTVRGDFIASLQLSSYSNPSHRHAGGGCCDFAFFSCGNCDNYFVVCVESLCRHTGYVGNRETLRFGARVGDVPNPLTFSVPGVYTSSVHVEIDVYDRDDIFPATINGDEFVDQFILNFNRSPNSPTGVHTFNGRYRRGTISLSLTVFCSQGYYGPDCAVFCQAGPTYTCGSDGLWQCREGWTGAACDSCRPHPSCSAEGGYCEEPWQCLCRDGFTGQFCDTPPSPPTAPPTTAPSQAPTDTPTSTPLTDTSDTPTSTPLTDTSDTPTSTPLTDTSDTPTSTPLTDTSDTPTSTPLTDTSDTPTSTPLTDTSDTPTSTPLTDTSDTPTSTPLTDTSDTPTSTPLTDTSDTPTSTPLTDTSDTPTSTPLTDTSDTPTSTPLTDTSDTPTSTPLTDTSDTPTSTPLTDTSDTPTSTPLTDTSDTPTSTPLTDTSDTPTSTPLTDTSDTPTSTPLTETSDTPTSTPSQTPTSTPETPTDTTEAPTDTTETPTDTPEATDTTETPTDTPAAPITTEAPADEVEPPNSPVPEVTPTVDGDSEEREPEEATVEGLQADGNDSHLEVIVGGVVGGVAMLLVVALVVLASVYCLYRKRAQERKLAEEDLASQSLVQSLVGENPTYMEHCHGSFQMLNSCDYHDFSNPLYQDMSCEEAAVAEPSLRRCRSSPAYSYPRTRNCVSHLVSSVYLPGDNSPLSGSLSSTHAEQQERLGQQQGSAGLGMCNGGTGEENPAGLQRGSVHYEFCTGDGGNVQQASAEQAANDCSVQFPSSVVQGRDGGDRSVDEGSGEYSYVVQRSCPLLQETRHSSQTQGRRALSNTVTRNARGGEGEREGGQPQFLHTHLPHDQNDVL